MSGFGIISLAVLSILHGSCSPVHCAGEVPDPEGPEFALSAYCKSMCQWNRGGNLCNCHAAYFAGKRLSSTGGNDGGQVPVVPGRSDRQSTVNDDESMWIDLSAGRRPLNKLSTAAAERDGEIAEDDVERRWWTATEELRRHLRSASSNSLARSP